MRRVLEGLEGQAGLQDGMTLFGHTTDEHDTRLHQVLQSLQEAFSSS